MLEFCVGELLRYSDRVRLDVWFEVWKMGKGCLEIEILFLG